MKLTLQEAIIELLLKFELALENCAIQENNEISEYASKDFEIMEVFDDLNESMSNVIKPIIPSIVSSEMQISDIPEVARLYDFESFAKYFEQHESLYPHICKWAGDFVEWSTTFWDPLNWAIRGTFHENPSQEISNRSWFELLFQGYVNISEETKYAWDNGYEYEVLRILELLKDSKFAMTEEITSIETLEGEIRSIHDDSSLRDVVWDFQGATRHLEKEVWNLIRRNLFSLFDDMD